MVFVGPDYVVTVRHGEAAALSGVRGDLGPYLAAHPELREPEPEPEPAGSGKLR